MSITLEYKRLAKEVDGEYPYTGEFKLPDGNSVPFIGWKYRDIIGALSDYLNKFSGESEVVIQRVDREGILPMGFGPVMIDLLRKDPLSAYRTLNFNSQTRQSSTGAQHSTLARVFGTVVYLRMRGGKVQCPLTGEWRGLAFGEKQGWKIRGEENSHEKWVPLLGLVDDAPSGTEGVQRLVFCTWAQVSVQALLDLGAPEYYLPRPWNPRSSGWIDREPLEERLREAEQQGD